MNRTSHFAAIAAALALSGCLSHPPPPEAPYHAYGKDNAWNLIIDDRNVTFIPADGQPIVQPKPQVIVGIAGEIYQAGRIDVNIVHGPCQVRDRNFADRVQVRIDGDMAYEGCGGDFTYAAPPQGMAGPLEGRSWRVIRINGRPTPTVGDYSMSFSTEGQIGARFGCNSIGGLFTRSGNIVTTRDIVGTQMGCSEPAESFETQGSRVMMQPMRLRWDGPTVSLYNSAGEIVLAPA